MKKGIVMMKTGREESRYKNTVLAIISAAFLLGGILGFLLEKEMQASSYTQLFFQEAITSSTIGRELWWVFRWPVGMIILQLLPMVGFTIPAFMCLRGFILSYSISAFAQVQMKAATLLFGPTCILTLPVLFLLSTEILLRKAGEQSEDKSAVILACLLSLLLCIVLDLTVVPALLA